jgi:hypothetical protein
MNNSKPSHNLPDTDWQMLGELELPVGSSSEKAIHAWLSNVLNPLALQVHFLNQIIQSAQDAAGRAMRSERAAEFRHLHFLVHVPKYSASNGQTWGFFQIEKMGDSTEVGNSHDHTIEFYLYLEG